MKGIVLLLSRVFISIIFIISCITKITDPSGTINYMSAYKMPYPGFFLIGAILLEGIGGLSLLLGIKTKWGSLMLLIFLIPTTIIFHTDFSQRLQVIMFLKNLAIMGGLLIYLYAEPDPLSLDYRLLKGYKGES